MNYIQFSNAQLLPEIFSLIAEGHTVTLRLRGNSMRPFLADNRDKALLASPAAKPRKGDPVLAETAPHKYVLHRIVKVDGDNLTLRGDGNLNDEHCRCSDIRARVIGFYRKGSDKLDPIEGWKWKTYSFFWTRLYPIRRYLLAIHRRLYRYT